jgi:CheY-like chemotaxis protein
VRHKNQRRSLLQLPLTGWGDLNLPDMSGYEVLRSLRVSKVKTPILILSGSLSSTTAKLMVFKLVIAASKTWHRLKGENQLPKVIGGVRFQDGIEVIEVPANHAA